jgi:hypothetical protein
VGTTAAVADEEWATIERRLDGVPVDVPRAQRRARLALVLGVLIALVVIVVVVLFVVLGPDGSTSGGDSASRTGDRDGVGVGETLLTVVSFVGTIAALVIWGVGFIRVSRGGGFPLWTKEPTLGVPRTERRTIERTMTGRIPPDPDHVPLLRRLAALRLEQSRWTTWFFSGWIPLSLGQAANAHESWLGLLQLSLAVLWVVLLVVLSARRRSWHTFISDHAGPGDPISGT